MKTVRFNEAWTANLEQTPWTDPSSRFPLTQLAPGMPDPSERRKEIVDLLLGWRLDPSQLVLEEMDPPSPQVIDAALRVLDTWCKQRNRPPDRVVPNADGGLAFEWYPDPWFLDLEFFADGALEWRVSKNAELVDQASMRWKGV